jgi:hypothetical protein
MSAVKKAVAEERARCLWILDTIVSDLKRQLNRKLLIESERHLVQVKLGIAVAFSSKAKRLIISGVEPKKQATTAEEIVREIADEENNEAR